MYAVIDSKNLLNVLCEKKKYIQTTNKTKIFNHLKSHTSN